MTAAAEVIMAARDSKPERTNRRPFDAPPADAAVQRGERPWPEAVGLTAEAQATRAQPELHGAPVPVERPLRHNLRTRKVYSLLKRVVSLELAETETPQAARVRIVIDLDMALPALGDPPNNTACLSPTGAAEELAGIAGGVELLLTRKLKEQEDFKVLTWEQQQWLDKMPLDSGIAVG
jgi:hypothetical protein